MQAKSFLWASITIIVGVLVAGCNSSGSGQPPAPQPSARQSAATASARTVEGHTEDHSTHKPSPDDGDHCFKQDDTRDLVLTVTAPEIKTGKVSAQLIDLLKGPVADTPTIVTKDDTATITFSDQGASAQKLTSKAMVSHLGPGPYVAATVIAGGTTKSGAQRQAVVIAFPYVTYVKDQSECP